MKTFFFLLLSAARAQEPSCLQSVTPELLIEKQFGGRIPALYDYAACAELIGGKPSLCDRFPGGERSDLPGDKAPRPYTYPGADGKVHHTNEYSVCDSRSAGYLMLALILKGAPRSEMLPFMKRMLNNETGLSAETVLDSYLKVQKTRSVDGDRLTKLGFFHHLLGAKACQDAPFEKLRKECVLKAAALEALKAQDDKLCGKNDLMCLALVRGESVCKTLGKDAVHKFCSGDKPAWREWRLAQPPLR